MAHMRAPYTHFKRLSFPNSFKVSSPQLNQLVSKLNVRVLPRYRTMSNPEGLNGRLRTMRKTVSALVKNERIEVSFYRGDEARGYMERLITEAIRYGDTHNPTMNLAKFWLEDEAAIPKLFKVLVPRYKDWPSGLPYTRMLRLPSTIKSHFDNQEMRQMYRRAVLELRGNPYPPLPGPLAKPHSGAIHNVLLEEARKEYFRQQSKMEREAEREINA